MKMLCVVFITEWILNHLQYDRDSYNLKNTIPCLVDAKPEEFYAFFSESKSNDTNRILPSKKALQMLKRD